MFSHQNDAHAGVCSTFETGDLDREVFPDRVSWRKIRASERPRHENSKEKRAENQDFRDVSAFGHLLSLLEGDRLCNKRRNKVREVELRYWLGVLSLKTIHTIGHQKARGVVQPLANQFGQKNFVTPGIRFGVSFLEYLEVALLRLHRSGGSRCIFQ